MAVSILLIGSQLIDNMQTWHPGHRSLLLTVVQYILWLVTYYRVSYTVVLPCIFYSNNTYTVRLYTPTMAFLTHATGDTVNRVRAIIKKCVYKKQNLAKNLLFIYKI